MTAMHRVAMKLALCLIVIAPAALCQRVDTLNILHTSDTHIIYDLGLLHPAFSGKPSVAKGGIDSLERFFSSVPKQVGAQAVVITGDVTDIYEGETKSHQLLASQVEHFRSLYDKCPVSLFLTLGNHEITTYRVRESDAAIVESQTNAGRARASWIRNIPCFYDGTYFRKVFQLGKTNYHFLFLDNGYSLHDGGRVIDKTQLDWLQEQMSKSAGEPVVLFFHVYFSVGDMNGDGISFKENGPLHWPNEKQCADGLLKVLNENRNILALVVGHGHSNIFEKIQFPNGHSINQIETGSVTEGLGNWRLFQFTENGLTVSFAGSRKTEIVIEKPRKAN